MFCFMTTKTHINCAKSCDKRRVSRITQKRGGVGMRREEGADRGAGGQRERGLGSADERMVKGREGEGRAALYARMR